MPSGAEQAGQISAGRPSLVWGVAPVWEHWVPLGSSRLGSSGALTPTPGRCCAPGTLMYGAYRGKAARPLTAPGQGQCYREAAPEHGQLSPAQLSIPRNLCALSPALAMTAQLAAAHRVVLGGPLGSHSRQRCGQRSGVRGPSEPINCVSALEGGDDSGAGAPTSMGHDLVGT